MNDDWRVQILFREEGVIDKWHDNGHARELERDLSDSFHDRVIVSRDDSVLFVYAGDRSQAERARALVERQAQERGWELESDLTHWNEERLEWEPLSGRSLSAAEAETDINTEDSTEPAPTVVPPAEGPQEVEEPAVPEFEVRVDLPSRHDADHLADRLTAEGFPCVRRWRHVVVGATDEEAAQELAERIRMEAPIGSQATIKGLAN